MERTERSLVFYASLLIGFSMITAKLLTVRSSLLFRYWRFDLLEIAFQFLLTFAYCYALFFVNLHPTSIVDRYRVRKQYFFYLSINLIVIALYVLFGGIIHYRLFAQNQAIRAVFWSGHFTRFTITTIFVFILLKLLLIVRESKRRDRDHQLLRASYLEAELELLKSQLNPHFLFNALTSLSGIIREDASLAQQYVNHLSRIFRYSLIKPDKQLSTVADELSLLDSYGKLLSLRYENAFNLEITVGSSALNCKLPHLSLQPLLENAAKHNIVSANAPLHVHIYSEDNFLVVRNNLTPLTGTVDSTGLGLANLNQRYRILTAQEIEISRTAGFFMVKLPLVK